MRFTGLRAVILAIVFLPSLPLIAQYSAQRDGDIVRLEDSKNQTVVSIVPSVGDVVFEMKVKGQDILRFPFPSIEAFRAKPSLSGIPFLSPWANRLDEQAFYANGKRYAFNMTLGNVSGATPIHGFLTSTPFWEVVEVKADHKAAWVTSRLDFYRHPDWMAQFPFAHTIEITQRLENGVLEVRTRIDNLSTDPMPVAIGFHPYYQLTDSKREDWVISVGARLHWLLAPNKIPTGETTPIEQFFPNPNAAALKDYNLDDVFSDLVRDSSGRASLSVKGKHQEIEVEFGPNYKAAVIFSPNPNTPGPPPPPLPPGAPARPPREVPNFVAFEPMAGITDSMNLAYKGLYKELQYIPPGGSWQESFWVRPTGF
jgi:aldose 1-epimerase